MKAEDIQKVLERLVEIYGELTKTIEEVKALMIAVSKEIK